ncbi:MAG: tetratricopeptide repeat protein [Candidatus Solibacter usitatus]|nr:tetratricopeptide repeat protein [Candidatus Solibacter usitatus]
MHSLGDRPYRILGLELDPSQRMLRRDGEAVVLRPRTFDLLLYLVERRQRVVLKRELLDALWPGLSVTENSIERCINEARKALGDDSRDPRFIRTVSKSGYQFIGPVEEPGTDTEVVEQITSVQVEIEVPEPLPSPPARRTGRRLLAALAAASLAIAAAGFWWIKSSPARMEAIVVMPFENASGTQELDWLREGLADMVIANFSRAPGWNVIGRQFIAGRLQSRDTVSFDRAIAVSRGIGAGTVLLGSFARLGGQVSVTVQVYGVPDGRLRAGGSFVAGEPGQILTHIDLLSQRTMRTLGLPARAADSLAAISSVMTGNIEAYRNYSLGMEKAEGLHASDALQYFQRAVQLDAQFAMAHARIGYTYAVSWGRPSEGKPHLETAFRMSNRLTARDRLHIAAWYALACHDYAAAIKGFRELLSLYPHDVETYVRLGSLLSGERQFGEAVGVLQKGLVLDPSSTAGWNVLSSVHSRAGRQADAVAAGLRYTSLAPAEPNAWDTLGMAYHADGQLGQADQSYRRALELKKDFEVALIHLANLKYQQGRYREALAHGKEFLNLVSTPAGQSRAHVLIGLTLHRMGRLEEARRSAQVQMQLMSGHGAELLLEMGDFGKAAELLRRPPDVNARGRRLEGRTGLYENGRVALANGDRERALTLLRSVLAEPPAYHATEWREDCLAEAYMQLGMLSEAIEEYQRALMKYPALARMRYRLALAYQQLGKTGYARADFHRFLKEWNQADADAPEVIDARRRLGIAPGPF